MAQEKRTGNFVTSIVVYDPVAATTQAATGEALTNSTPIDVKIVDGDGTQITSFGGGTQYTEGATDATITGTAMMMEVAADTLQPVQGTVAAGLLVNLGSNNDVTLATLPDTSSGDLAAINSAVSGTLTVGSHAVTNAGTFAVQDSQDVMLGTDFSAVFGSASLISATPAVKVEEQGTVTVDLGANNDVTTEIETADLDTGAGTDTQAVVGLLSAESGGGALVGSAAPLPVNLYAGGVALTETGGTLYVNVQNFAVGQFGDGDDVASNLTSAMTFAEMFVYDGSTWDRLRGDSTDGVLVNLGSNNDVTVTSGAVNATLAAETTKVIGTVRIASGGVASGSFASGSIASGAIASGALASGSIAAGAIAAGATSIADNEDVASANADRLVKVAARRTDALVANDNTSATGDYTQFKLDNYGALWGHPLPTSADLATMATAHVKKYYTASAPTDGIVWSPAAGKRWFVTDIFIGVSAASTVTLEDDLTAGDSAVWKMELAANSGWSHSFKTPLFSGEDAADLIVTASAGTVYVTAVGYEI